MRIRVFSLILIMMFISVFLNTVNGTPSITIDLVYPKTVAPSVPFKLEVILVNPVSTGEPVHNPKVTAITLQRVTRVA